MKIFRLIKIKDVIFITREKFSSRVLDSYQLNYYIDKFDIDKKSKHIGEIITSYLNNIKQVQYNYITENISTTDLTSIKDAFILNVEKLTIPKREKVKYLELGDEVVNDYYNIEEDWLKIRKGEYTNDVYFIYRNPIKSLFSGIFQDLFNNESLKFSKSNFDFIYTITKDEYKDILFTDKFFENYKFENNYFFELSNKLQYNDNYKKFILSSVINHININGLSSNHKGTWLEYFKNTIYNNLSNSNFKLINLDTGRKVDYFPIISKIYDVQEDKLKINFSKKDSTENLREILLEGLKSKDDIEVNYFIKRINEYTYNDREIYKKIILSNNNLYKTNEDLYSTI